MSNNGPGDGLKYYVERNGRKTYFDAVRVEVKDGLKVEVLISAKGRYDQYTDDDNPGEFQMSWKYSEGGGLPLGMEQARLQVAAAGGRDVEWWCAELRSAFAFDLALRKNPALNGRAVAVYRPMPEDEH